MLIPQIQPARDDHSPSSYSDMVFSRVCRPIILRDWQGLGILSDRPVVLDEVGVLTH